MSCPRRRRFLPPVTPTSVWLPNLPRAWFAGLSAALSLLPCSAVLLPCSVLLLPCPRLLLPCSARLPARACPACPMTPPAPCSVGSLRVCQAPSRLPGQSLRLVAGLRRFFLAPWLSSPAMPVDSCTLASNPRHANHCAATRCS